MQEIIETHNYKLDFRKSIRQSFEIHPKGLIIDERTTLAIQTILDKTEEHIYILGIE